MTLTEEEIIDANLTGWEFIDDALLADFPTGDFATGLKLVALIGDSAEEANHHPDILLTYPSVTVTLTTHDKGGVTQKDIDLAKLCTKHAASLGVDAA